MKHTLLFLFSMALLHTQAQYCTGDSRFTETPFFTDAQVAHIDNISFATVTDWQNNAQTLNMNIYFPKPSIDPMPLRPLVVMVHGGGLVGGSKTDMNQECYQFARRGYVAATIDYRLGRDCDTDSLSYDKAAYRAMQDLHAALRYLVHNSDTLRTDTSALFIGGGSAGSSTCFRLLYMRQDEWNTVSPAMQSTLGSLDTSGNSLTDDFNIKGFFNNWGGSLKQVIETVEMIPTIAFHGDADSTVAIDSANTFSCITPVTTYGSRMIHQLLTGAGICSELSILPGGGHGIYQDSSGTALRVGRAACFFKSIFCAACNSYYTETPVEASCSPTAIQETSTAAGGHFYPNPFTSRIHFYGATGNERFTLYNTLGERLYEGKNIEQENFSGLTNGLYIIKVSAGGNTQLYKLVKQ